MIKFKLITKVDASKWLSVLDFSQKAISRRVIKIPVYNEGVLNRHRPRAAGYLNSGFTCQQIRYLNSLNSQHGWIFNDDIEWLRFSYRIILFKFWIANMAGFLLWLSITSIMIEVFKVALAPQLLSLSMGMIYFTMEEIVPSHCRLTTRHLGVTLFKLRLHQNMQVSCRCKHAPWHLGANAKSFLLALLKTRLIPL